MGIGGLPSRKMWKSSLKGVFRAEDGVGGRITSECASLPAQAIRATMVLLEPTVM